MRRKDHHKWNKKESGVYFTNDYNDFNIEQQQRGYDDNNNIYDTIQYRTNN